MDIPTTNAERVKMLRDWASRHEARSLEIAYLKPEDVTLDFDPFSRLDEVNMVKREVDRAEAEDDTRILADLCAVLIHGEHCP